MRVLRPEQYETFDVKSKQERIRTLLPLGLMRIQELLEEVCTLAGTGMRGSPPPAAPGSR